MTDDRPLVDADFYVARIEVAPYTKAQARRVTERIKLDLVGVWFLITDAYKGRIWIPLGYSNWDEYCIREFGSSRVRLPREERPEVVASLRQSGLSIRAIASATGIDNNTVQSDLAQVSEIHTPESGELIDAEVVPEPKPITGLDGKTYQPHKPPEPKPEPSIDEWASMMVKFRAAKRNLQEILGLALNIHGFAEREGQREATAEMVAKVRIILDAIDTAAKGGSMDTELKRLLGGDGV